MRINVYSQELDLIRIPEAVVKEGTNDTGAPERFLAVRFFLVSPDTIHQTSVDDDQSAVTFWLPKSNTNRANLAEHFRYMAWLVEEADSGVETEEGNATTAE